jgi:hypothetical protein
MNVMSRRTSRPVAIPLRRTGVLLDRSRSIAESAAEGLAPVFAAALATKDSWDAFLVGMAASLGAGISMALPRHCPMTGVLPDAATFYDEQVK